MFSKKIKCRCGKKVNTSFSFCPYCGANLKEKIEEDKEKKKRDEQLNAMIKDFEKAFDMPFFMKFPFEKLVKSMIKDIEKQFQEYDELLAKHSNSVEKPKIVTSGISINIKSTPEGEPIIQIKEFGPGSRGEKEIKEIEGKEEVKLPKVKISEAEAAKRAKLPREEPETKVRRLTDKIIYEISLPGVRDEKNIIINKLQNSIEIKAFAKDKAYFKLIPLGLPIKNYKLEKEKLILELKP